MNDSAGKSHLVLRIYHNIPPIVRGSKRTNQGDLEINNERLQWIIKQFAVLLKVINDTSQSPRDTRKRILNNLGCDSRFLFNQLIKPPKKRPAPAKINPLL